MVRVGVSGGGGASDARTQLVDRARQAWIARLIDLSRRNNLLYFRELKLGTLNLAEHDPRIMTALLKGQSVSLWELLPRADEVRVLGKVQEIRRRALANLEEKGLETLFVAVGMASWKPGDEGRPAAAPVILLPVAIESKGREGRALTLHRTGDVQANLVLLHLLESDYGCTVSADALLNAGGGGEEAEVEPDRVFGRLRHACPDVPQFSIDNCAVLSNFSFQKMAMVKDLRERLAELVAHDLIAAMAGDAQAAATVAGSREPVDEATVAAPPLDDEYLVFDADSSQHRVVAEVVAGHDGVIHGPPGTGKSQTIANLIATLAAKGRRVLFVAEKRAALDVVKDRLQRVDLGCLVLDLHGADISRRAVMQQIAESLALVREAPSVDVAQLHRQLHDRRNRLNQYVTELHAARAPSGLSVYRIQGRLLRLPQEAHSVSRWRGAALDRLDLETAETVRELLREASGFPAWFFGTDPSPWAPAQLGDAGAVEQAVELAHRLARERWPRFRAALVALSKESGLRLPETLDDAGKLVSVLAQVNETLSQYDAALFEMDLETLSAALAPARRGMLVSCWAWCTRRAFRKAVRTVRAIRREKRVSRRQLYAEAANARDQRQQWKSRGAPTPTPSVVAGVDVAARVLQELLDDLAALGRYVPDFGFGNLPLSSLEHALVALAEDSITPFRLPRLLRVKQDLETLGLGAFLAELREHRPEPRYWGQLFEYAWLTSCLDRARAESDVLGAFDGRTHDSVVAEFRELDRDHIRLAAARVRRAFAEHAIEVRNQHPEQDTLVKHEAAKKTRHVPVRKLLAEAPDVLTALRPCWMASPLSVSQLLGADRRYFDVVIFDEASQVLPEDAVPAVLRASQAVVAGDRHQLPPTTFFVAGEDDEEDGDAASEVAGFESVLDLMQGFVEPWLLDWHYRSRDEALIAFSNRHVYSDRLVTFPGPGGPPVISHVLVPSLPDQDGQEESAAAEVQRVVELVIAHASSHPQETLGVIAMGIKHARRVEATIEQARRDRPELDEFFDQKHPERFFVKNLERVQGDERDAIILTIGYGKDRTGRLLYRFGPLLYEGGERRLNVAVTRARMRLTLVSSFSHLDMDPGRSNARGVELLRRYLEYAATGGHRLGDGEAAEAELNDFEQDVYDALTARGIGLKGQWGASRYRIDLVAQHPHEPGRFVLAIECDGAGYHSSYAARERDRLRQQHLEALGWRFHRIWSTDWFARRPEEIERAARAYGAAIAGQDPKLGSGKTSTRRRVPVEGGAAADGNGAGRVPLVTLVPHNGGIEDYTPQELDAAVRTVISRSGLLTDDEIVDATVRKLGFKRRGARIEAAIREAIDRVRRT